MINATEVFVFFVGLALWSEEVPNDCGVKAILPRVEHTTCGENVHHPAASPSPVSLLPIQNHQAAIVFPGYSFVRESSLLAQNGWGAPQELPGQDSAEDDEKLLFVKLDGESVRFLTNGATNAPADLTGLKLAHVREQLCPARSTLGPEYQPPYKGAAAVVALPGGTVQACLSVPDESVGRLDTRVNMKTNGTLDISGGNEKKLRLKPRSPGEPIQLMIVNLPESFFEGTPATSGGISHMNVYLAMAEPSAAACTLSLRQWWDQLDPAGIPLCNAAPSLVARGTSPEPGAMLSVLASAANFECSNSMWP